MNLMTSDEYQLLGDARYRTYVSQIEKALKGFEYTNEWADLISALTKLNKVLASHKYAVIPKRMTIGKRLAQCMHPALPAGVHLKAIEVYETVFKLIGNEKLADELYVYSSGLFPLMANAASNVRPALLKVYEMYFLPLGHRLRSATTGLLLGVLPGLEEGSESYQWSNELLEQLSVAVGQMHFYGSLWTCILTFHAVRLPATSFILAHFDRKAKFSDQLHLMGPSIDTVILALQASVQDTQVLVQRNALDFAVLAFPFHAGHVSKADQRRLLAAALSVFLRRDMSLNRRLFSWLLGLGDRSTGLDAAPGDNSEKDGQVLTDYFSQYSRPMLVDILNEIILASSSDSALGEAASQVCVPSIADPSAVRSIRILNSLIDKQEIGSLVLEDVLVNVFRVLRSSYARLHPGRPDRAAGEQFGPRPAFYEHPLRLTQVTETLRDRHWKVGHRSGSSTSSGSAPPSRRPSPATTGGSWMPQQPFRHAAPAKDTSADIVKSVTAVFANLQQGFLWSFVGDLLCRLLRDGWRSPTTQAAGNVSSATTSCGSSSGGRLNFVEACELVEVVLRILCPEDGRGSCTPKNDQGQHVTILLRDLLMTLKETVTLADASVSMPTQSQLQDMHAALMLCAYLLAASPPSLSSPTVATDYGQNSAMHSSSMDANCKTTADTEDARGCSEPIPMSHCADIYLELFPIIVGICCGNDRSTVQPTSYAATCDSQLPKIVFASESHLKAGVVMLACKLIVDFSSVPLYCTSKQRTSLLSSSRVDKSCGSADDGDSCPPWLLWMLTLVFRCDHFYVSSVALCSLLDLVCLAHLSTEQLANMDSVELSRGSRLACGRASSMGSDGGSSSAPSASASAEALRFYVLSWPALTPTLYRRLFGSDVLFRQIARLVWARIGPAMPEAFNSSISCVILNHLLQLVPNEAVVEDVVASALVNPIKVQKFEAHEKLFDFWHVTSGLSQAKARVLNRPMLMVLMALSGEDAALCLLVRDWLLQLLEEERGIVRLMEPLLIALLHPDSARVEVRRLQAAGTASAPDGQPQSPSQVSSEGACRLLDERRIYAISHEGGSVKYHVMDQKTASQKFPQSTSAVVKAAVTAMDGDGVKTSRSVLSPEDDFQRVRADSVKLHVNPFGTESSLDRLIFDGYQPHASIRSDASQKEAKSRDSTPVPIVADKPPSSSYDDIIARARRMDSETCRREGITFGLEDEDDVDIPYFDDSASSSGHFDDPEAIAKSIVEDLFARALELVTKTRVLHSPPADEPSPALSAASSRSRHSSAVLDGVDGNVVRSSNSGSVPSHSAASSAASGAAMPTPLIPGPPASPKHSFGAERSDASVAVMATTAVDGSKVASIPPTQAAATFVQGIKMNGKQLEAAAPTSERLLQSLHVALYTQAYDCGRVLCALACIKSVLRTSPSLALYSLASQSVGSLPNAAELVQRLMQRHRRCLTGGSGGRFYEADEAEAAGGGTSSPVGSNCLRQTTLLEALTGLAAAYARSYYTELRPDASTSGDAEGCWVEVDGVRRRWPAVLPRISPADVDRNAAVQAASLDVLNLIVSHCGGCIGPLSSSSALAGAPPEVLTRISELTAREHLNWLVAGLVNSFVFWTSEHWSKLGISWRQPALLEVHSRTVALAASVIAFDHGVAQHVLHSGTGGQPQQQHGSLRGRLCERDGFMRCLAASLEGCAGGEHAWHVQLQWLQAVVGCLPYFGSSLTAVVCEAVNRLCVSIDSLLEPPWTSAKRLSRVPAAATIGTGTSGEPRARVDDSRIPGLPSGHITRVLQLFSSLVHYVLLDGSTVAAIPSEGSADGRAGPVPFRAGSTGSGLATTHLVAVFDPLSGAAPEVRCVARSGDIDMAVSAAVKPLLGMLPRVITVMYRLWAAAVTSPSSSSVCDTSTDTTLEQLHVCKVDVQSQILGFLAPICASTYLRQLLSAMIIVWNELRTTGTLLKKFSPDSFVLTAEQNAFINLLMCIRALHCDALTDSLCKLLRALAADGDFPKTGQSDCDSKWPLYVGAIHLLQCYAHVLNPMSANNILSFCSFTRDVLQQSPSPAAVLLLFRFLVTIVHKLSVVATFVDAEKKMLKELQEVTQKVVEACCTIVASQLEPTAWLQTRKNYSVKAPSSRQTQGVIGPAADSAAAADDDDDDTTANFAGATKSASSVLLLQPAGRAETCLPADQGRLMITGSLEQYSVVALDHLAENLARLLDVSYPSEDKDKAVPVLVSVFHHVLPYLRNHSAHNVASYRACSQLLASVSSYGYTRRAWRRDALELLLAPDFFQMDRKSLEYWQTVTDYLMTQDKQAFKDLLARLTLSGAPAMSLFGGGIKDQELELRGQYMKRLAFVIFSSDIDQYRHNLPDIQERLAECLRLPLVPSLQAQVFLCLRVLLIRMSAQHLTSLWPTIVTELVQVLLQIEQELSTDFEDSRALTSGGSAQVSRLAALDVSWAHGNGLHAHTNPAWLQLYASACRLLDLLCYLPDDRIPEFHHYLWMFMSAEGGVTGRNVDNKGFVPHVDRIEHRMQELFGPCPVDVQVGGAGGGKGLVMTDVQVTTLRDLHAVFYALTHQSCCRPQSRPIGLAERYVEADFLEVIPQ